MKKSRIAAGVRVRTNAALSRMFAGEMAKPWQGRAVAPSERVEGCWKVAVDGVAPLQHIHEKFLEVVNG